MVNVILALIIDVLIAITPKFPFVINAYLAIVFLTALAPLFALSSHALSVVQLTQVNAAAAFRPIILTKAALNVLHAHSHLDVCYVLLTSLRSASHVPQVFTLTQIHLALLALYIAQLVPLRQPA
jgi:hypothetical protein